MDTSGSFGRYPYWADPQQPVSVCWQFQGLAEPVEGRGPLYNDEVAQAINHPKSLQAYQHIAVEVPPGQPDTGARSSRSEKAPKLPSMIVVDTVDRAD